METVLVIGGGPAGLAAAIAARLKGFEVTVMDAARPPVDKACGEAVLPAGVEALRRLGIQPYGDHALALKGIRFLDGGVSVEAGFRRCGAAVRRLRLHELLTRRADEVGVRMLWGTRAPELPALSSFRWIVGADGQNSRVREEAGLNAHSRGSARFGFRRHFRMTPWTDFVEVHWGRACQVYVTPVSCDEVGVALLTRDSHVRVDAALEEFPELQRRLRGAEASSTERGALTVSRRLRRVYGDNVALIGDASGSVDAITGEGLSLSFHQALALGDAMAARDLALYQAEHARLARRPAFFARVLLLLDRFPTLRRGALKMLAKEPAIFAELLTRHAM